MPDEFSRPPPSVRAQQILSAYAAYKAQYASTEAQQQAQRQEAARTVTTIPTRDTTVFTPQSPPQKGTVNVSEPQLERINTLRESQGLPPLESIANVNVVKGTTPSVSIKQPDVDTQLSQWKSQGATQVNIYNKAGARIGTVPISTAKQAISAVSQFQDVYYRPAPTQTFTRDQIAKQRDDLVNFINEAKNAGLTTVDLFNAQGIKVGTINVQNPRQARLDTIRAAQQYGQVTPKATITQTKTETTTTTPTFREDPLSLLARPILQFGAEFGLQILEDIKTGKMGGGRLFLDKSQVSAAVGEQAEKTFGTGEEVSKTLSTDYTIGQKIAAISGIAASVAIPTIAGTKLAKVPEFGALGAKLTRTESLATLSAKVEKGFQESPLTVQKEGGKAFTLLSQGTEGITSPGAKYETKAAPAYTARTGTTGGTGVGEQFETGGKVETLIPPKPTPAKGSEIIGVGAKGEKVPTGRIEVALGSSAVSKEAVLPYAVVTKEKVTFIREPSGSTPQKIIIKGPLKPEVAATLGLVESTPGEFTGKASKGVLEYLAQAEKAKLVTEPLAEAQAFPSKVVTKAPDVYAEVSRKPELIKGKKFPDILRPEITQYRETYPIREKPIKTEKVSRPSKTSTPFGQEGVKPTAAQKAREELQTRYPLMTSHTETKAGVEKLTGILTTEKQGKVPTDYLGLAATQNVSTISALETEVVAFPPRVKDISLESQITKGLSTTRTKDVIIQSIGTKISEEQAAKTTTSTVTKLLQKQETVTEQQTKQIQDLVGGGPPKVRGKGDGGPPPGGFVLLPPEKPEDKKRKIKGKKKFNFLGNVPVTGLTGVYKRQDIIYGTKRINKLVGSEVRETGKRYGGKFSKKKPKF